MNELFELIDPDQFEDALSLEEQVKFLENLKQVAEIQPYGLAMLEAMYMGCKYTNQFEEMGEHPGLLDLLTLFMDDDPQLEARESVA